MLCVCSGARVCRHASYRSVCDILHFCCFDDWLLGVHDNDNDTMIPLSTIYTDNLLS